MANAPLTFSAEEVKEKYPEFFRVYPFIPEETKVGDIFSEFFKNKDNLRKVFNIGPSGRSLVATYAQDMHTVKQAMLYSFETFFSLMTILYPSIEFKDQTAIIFNNRLPCGKKFSKDLLEKYNALKNKDEANYILSRYDLCRELPRLPLAGRHDLSLIIQNFYSELSKLKLKSFCLHLTVSPFDIANASNGGFKSCNSIGNAYQQAPICAASSEHVAMLRLEDKATGELLGRNYVAISPDLKSIVIQPVYGFMKNEFVNDAILWITFKLDLHLGKPTKPWFRAGRGSIYAPLQDFVKNKYATFYVDPAHSYIVREDFTDIPAMRVGGCKCLVCGCDNLNLVCAKCKKKLPTCVLCGLHTSPGRKFCVKCSTNLRVCPKCNKIHVSYSKPGVDICSKCSSVYSKCLLCLEDISVYSNSNIIQILGGVFHVHKRCQEKLEKKEMFECATCGNAVLRGYHPDSHCHRCRKKNHAKKTCLESLNKFKRMREAILVRKQTLNIKPLGELILDDDTTYSVAL